MLFPRGNRSVAGERRVQRLGQGLQLLGYVTDRPLVLSLFLIPCHVFQRIAKRTRSSPHGYAFSREQRTVIVIVSPHRFDDRIRIFPAKLDEHAN